MQVAEVISRFRSVLLGNAVLQSFSKKHFGKEFKVHIDDISVLDVPIRNMPIILISDSPRGIKDEEQPIDDITLSVKFIILENNTQKVVFDVIEFRELIKQLLCNISELNGVGDCIAKCVEYCGSQKIKIFSHPLYAMELAFCVTYNE